MANQEHLEILKKGVEVWNKWREDNLRVIPDLTNARLNSANLFGVNLFRALLAEANLRGANLSEANFVSADLSGADLRDTNLSGAKLNAKLSGADLSSGYLSLANLSGADLSSANLHSANLVEANLIGTKLICANLSSAVLIGATLSYTNFISADITGANLYETRRGDWTIDRIKCDYIFWDRLGKDRTPKDRNFNPGEFEQLYKWRPLNEFEHLIERSIKFPPEYKQAGVSILNYFAEILRKKYPESNATVQIKQDGLKVIMTIDPAEGERQTFEEELNRFGLVTTGKITPEEYVGNNPLLLIELKSELRSAYNKIELQKELIHYQERELKKSDIQIERFFNIFEKGINPNITVSPTINVSPTIKGDESTIKARDITDSKLAAGNDNKITEAKGNRQ